MKKMKSLLMFAFMLTLFVVAFCFNASAAEWVKYSGIECSFDKDTKIAVVRAAEGGATAIGSSAFGGAFGCGYCCRGECECWDFWADPEDETAWTFENYAKQTRTLIIEGSIKTIGKEGCAWFENLETLILSDGITKIGEAAFYWLPKLKNVILPDTLVSIESQAFYKCRKIKNINIPESVEFIGRDAFYDCNSKYVKIPDTVKTVEWGNSDVPENLKEVEVASISNSGVTLRWTESKDATGYRIFVRNGNKWKKIMDGFCKGNSLTTDYNSSGIRKSNVWGLEPDTQYTFAVRPFHAVGYNYRSSSSEGEIHTYDYLNFAPSYVKITVKTAPATPTLKLTSTKAGKVAFSWNDVSSETGYQIWYSPKQYSSYKKYSNYKANTTKATLKGFTSGKTYYFKVRAYKKVDGKYIYSNYSDILKVKVK